MNAKAALLALFLTILFPLIVTAQKVAVPDSLIAALIHVESHGNDYAIGDRGRREMAYGALQIRKPCVEDVNRRAGTRFHARQMLGNRKLSVWVCRTYIETYSSPRLIGHRPTVEDMARIWNGGPSGWKRASTLGYWAKVRRAMARQGTLATIMR